MKTLHFITHARARARMHASRSHIDIHVVTFVR